jgi:O-antigen/teichoic acid export membrane protein
MRGARWNFVSQAFRIVAGLCSLAVLSRLLTADDFGLFAMSQGVMGCLSIVTEGGVSFATVQRSTLSQQQASNLFWMNLVLGLGATAVGCMSAPALAGFFGRSELVVILIACSISLMIKALGLQHLALLRRNLMQGRILVVTVTSVAIGLVTSIAVAALGYGWWALAAQVVAVAVGSTAATWYLCGWRPSRWSSGAGTRQIAITGGAWNLSELLGHVRRNVDQTLIGKFWGGDALGTYSRALLLISQIVLNFAMPIGAALTPALSRIHGQPERFRTAFIEASHAMMLLTVPACAFTLLTAREISDVVLGTKWSGCVPIVRALGPFAFAYCSVNALLGVALTAHGLTSRMLRLSVVSLVITGSVAAILVRHGAEAVAWGVGVSTLAVPLASLPFVLRGTGLMPVDFIRAITLPLFLCAPASAVSFLSMQAVPRSFPVIAVIGLGGVTFLIAYAGLLACIPMGRERLRMMARRLSHAHA